MPKLSGFCLMMKRAVYESIGGLDERFGLGLFDDDDLAERARRAGFALAVARDLFVHHFGSRTFVGNGIDAESLLDENARRFAAKWGQDRPRGRRVALRPFESAASPERRRSRPADDGSAVRPRPPRGACSLRSLGPPSWPCGSKESNRNPSSGPSDHLPRDGGKGTPRQPDHDCPRRAR